MSIFSALFTGVSGMDALSTQMGAISNNIANANTIGYKKVDTSFSALVTGASSGSTSYAPGGVKASKATTVDKQGLLQQTGNATDISISGNGFFVVKNAPNESNSPLYTRAGQFKEDKEGYLTNAAGMVLYGWPLDSNGNIPAANADLSSLKPINLSALGGAAAKTTKVDLSVNLKSSTPAAGTFARTLTVYDSLGKAQNVSMTFTKVAAVPVVPATMPPTTTPVDNTWNLTTSPAGTGTQPVQLTFSSDGRLTAPASGTATVSGISWGNGSSAQSIDFDISALTQFDSDSTVLNINQNGAPLGLRESTSVDKDGIVYAQFSNGVQTPVFKLPIVTFSNSNGLSEVSGGAYANSNESGEPNLREAGNSGAGLVAAGSLEQSNVDIADEFSKMIITQRSYAASSKVITSANSMLDDLLRIV